MKIIIIKNVKGMGDGEQEESASHPSPPLRGRHRFKKITDPRWCSIGENARTLVGALYIGLVELVRFIRTDPSVSAIR